MINNDQRQISILIPIDVDINLYISSGEIVNVIHLTNVAFDEYDSQTKLYFESANLFRENMFMPDNPKYY
jgi:hypothetical protein